MCGFIDTHQCSKCGMDYDWDLELKRRRDCLTCRYCGGEIVSKDEVDPLLDSQGENAYTF